MSLKDSIVKLKLIDSGFLPDIPYHLVSDKEMVHAFLNDSGDDYFHIMYPLVDDSLDIEYNNLVDSIKSELDKYVSSLKSINRYVLPDWVYSYMLGQVIGPKSSQLDRHDLLHMLDIDNMEDEFNKEVCLACYKASSTWLNKYAYTDMNSYTRPATLFGEPHIIKYLRLQESDALRGDN